MDERRLSFAPYAGIQIGDLVNFEWEDIEFEPLISPVKKARMPFGPKWSRKKSNKMGLPTQVLIKMSV